MLIKNISKVLAERLPSSISKNQTAYVKVRFISEELISDILEICDNLKIKGF